MVVFYDMKIRILAIGKVKEHFTQEWIDEFLKRLTKYCKLEIIEIKESNKSEEGKELLNRIKDNYFIVALERVGELMKTEDFSELIKKKIQEKNICFIIGGPEGLSAEVLQKSQLHLSLSNMTFTHQIARLLLIEQIYRAFTIIKGEKYHK